MFLILALLFVPVCYRGHLVKQGERIQAGAKVSWLFRLVYVRIRYENGKPSVKIYLFGIPVLKVKQYLNRKKEKKQAASAGENFPKRSIGSSGRTALPKRETGLSQDSAGAGTESFEKGIAGYPPFSGKSGRFPGRFAGRRRKIWFTIRRNCAKIREWYGFFTSLTFKRAWKTVKRRGTVILRHILPKKVRGYVRFGFFRSGGNRPGHRRGGNVSSSDPGGAPGDSGFSGALPGGGCESERGGSCFLYC